MTTVLVVFLLAAAGEPQEIPLPQVLRPDLTLELFVREPDIATPIALQVDDCGRVWAIESNTHFQNPGYKRHPTDRILVLEDTDGDGRADKLETFADEFQQSMGLLLAGEGRVYLATRRDVLLLEDKDRDGHADGQSYLARLQTVEEYPHNGLSGFAVGELGHLYFAIGENMGVDYTLVGSDGTAVRGGPEGGSIFRMRTDGSGLERVALGFWNTFHLAFDAFGRLFAVDNDPDSRPPCRLLHIVRGGDYGYRRWLGRKGLHPFTAWNGELPGTLPMVSGTGEAPSGVLPYEHDGLPADLRGSLLVTSWGDYRLERHRPEPRGASFRSHPEPLVQGGEQFRPVGIAVAPDGSVYFSDWVDREYRVHGKGRIWRLRAKDPVPLGAASAAPAPAAGDERARYQALAAAARRGELTEDSPALADPAPEVRAAAVRLLGDTRGVSDAWILKGLRDPHPGVRLEALIACVHGTRPAVGVGAAGGAVLPPDRLPPDLLAAIEALAVDPDPFLSLAAAEALARRAPPARLLELARADDPRTRLSALTALWHTGGPVARAEALPKLLRDPDLEVRRAAFRWAGEERCVDQREALESGFQLGPVSRPLFDAYLAAASLLRGESPEGRDAIARDDALFKLAAPKETAPALRALALRSLSPRHPGLTAKAFRGFLADPDAAVQREAVRSLRESALPDAPALLLEIASDIAGPTELRREAVAGLSRFAASMPEALADLASNGNSAIAREAARARRLASAVPPPASLAPASSPTAAPQPPSTPPASPEPAPTGAKPLSESERAFLLEGGDPAEGEILFFYAAGPACARCHAAGGRGGVAGPDLSAAGRNPRAKLLDSILTPSREVAPQFTSWVLETAGGVKVGTIIEEDAEGTISLAVSDGQVERLPRRAVRSRREAGTSLMPDGLTALLTPAELRDLLAYLEAQR